MKLYNTKANTRLLMQYMTSTEIKKQLLFRSTMTFLLLTYGALKGRGWLKQVSLLSHQNYSATASLSVQ